MARVFQRTYVTTFSINGLNHVLIGKPNNNSLLRKKTPKEIILKQKGTRMTKDDED